MEITSFNHAAVAYEDAKHPMHPGEHVVVVYKYKINSKKFLRLQQALDTRYPDLKWTEDDSNYYLRLRTCKALAIANYVDEIVNKLLSTNISESKSRKTLKESQIEVLNLSSLANFIYAYGNDLRVLHLNVKGGNFKSVHEALNSLYNEIFDAYDTVAELAISRNEKVKNPSTVVSIIKPLEARVFSCEEATSIAREEGLKVLDAICSIDGYGRAVQAALDDIIVSLDKTLNYIFARWSEAADAEEPSEGESFAYRGMFDSYSGEYQNEINRVL